MADKVLIGDIFFDGYKVTEELGSGTFGTVYKVVKKDASGEYIRALKHITIPSGKQQYDSVFNSMGGDISKVEDYFSAMLNGIVSEIQILNDLSEKGITNIVRYYAHNIVTQDNPKRYDIYILMEYLTPLPDYIASSRFTVRDVAKLGQDVLFALELCHKNGVIHRDIKDDNIFVTASGEYKIGDFGVSKVLKGSNRAESVKGTPNFIAPEVYIKGEGYTQSVDLYSLGIVLYRLLNYNRNPFLPPFPATYNPEDEDIAFNERMKGSVPNLPSEGGALIGQAVVEAILNKTERYSSAAEFSSALEKAVNNSDSSVLNKEINAVKSASSPKSQTISEAAEPNYGETIKESVSNISDKSETQTLNSSVHKNLFETVGESYSPPVPEARSAETPFQPVNNEKASYAGPVVDVPPIVGIETPKSIDNNVIKKIVFILPLLLLVVGIAVFLIVLPSIYGKVVSLIDWLFKGPKNIIDTLKDADAVFPQVYTVIGIKVFFVVWFLAFITSLFFVGKQLQRKSEPNASNALMMKKEPYLAVQNIRNSLNLVKQRRSGKEIESIFYAVKKVEEKLSAESDFGYGNVPVIECENNIARQIQFLNDILPSLEQGNFLDSISKMNTSVNNINNLLQRRIELKKK